MCGEYSPLKLKRWSKRFTKFTNKQSLWENLSIFTDKNIKIGESV